MPLARIAGLMTALVTALYMATLPRFAAGPDGALWVIEDGGDARLLWPWPRLHPKGATP
jgi:hypothetical protein